MARWNDDGYSKRAKKENFLARSAFKLEEIDRREQLLKGAKQIIDLGASPGSWTQYCLRTSSKAKVIAVDIKPLGLNHERLTEVCTSVFDFQLEKYCLSKVDLVLSDMAPQTTGIRDTDITRSVELVERAFTIAEESLKPGGHFVAKLFMGEGFESISSRLKQSFERVRRIRPDSTRKHSKEIFLIGKCFRETTD